ncbi:MAG: hypothetical protein O3C63_06930 [Cyanobacteria bacterium]|nr:hypothetical protein [Cyanobacteriota bacterium]
MSYLLLLLLLVILNWFGYKLSNNLLRTNPCLVALPQIGKIAIDLVIGFSAFLLVTHFAAYVLNSFSQACYLNTFILAIWFLSDIKNIKNYIKETKISELNLSIIFYALILGFIAAYKNLYIGDSAKFHFAVISSIVNNQIYPPTAYFDFAQSFNGYHFGIVASSALYKILCGFDIFQASAIQLGLQVTLSVILLFSLFNLICKSTTWSIILTTVFIHGYSILQGSSTISWLFSRTQTLTFSCTIVLIIIFLSLEKQNYKHALLILSCLSFFLYFSFPANWYPLIVGAISFFIVESLFNKNWSQERTIFIASIASCLALGKFLTLMKPLTQLNGVEALVFKPGLRWYAMLNADTQNYLPKITSIQLDQMVTVPLFSWYSLKSFLLLFVIATLLFLIDSFHFQNFKKSILYFAASASMLVPFLYVFEPYPKDTQRFLFYSQMIFMLYILLFIAEHWQIKIPKQLNLIYLFSLMTIAYPVIFKPESFKTFAIPQSQRELIAELEKIHKSGDVMIDTEFLHINSSYTNLAGFYGVGGHFYSADTISKITAIYLLNPLLLQELNADYILITREYKQFENKVMRTVISPVNELSEQALTRMNDPQLFEIIKLKSSPTSLLLKFKAKNYSFSDQEKEELQQEYYWTIGRRNIYNFQLTLGNDGKLIKANSKAQLEPLFRKAQHDLAQTDVLFAASLSMGAKANPVTVPEASRQSHPGESLDDYTPKIEPNSP